MNHDQEKASGVRAAEEPSHATAAIIEMADVQLRSGGLMNHATHTKIVGRLFGGRERRRSNWRRVDWPRWAAPCRTLRLFPCASPRSNVKTKTKSKAPLVRPARGWDYRRVTTSPGEVLVEEFLKPLGHQPETACSGHVAPRIADQRHHSRQAGHHRRDRIHIRPLLQQQPGVLDEPAIDARSHQGAAGPVLAGRNILIFPEWN